MVWKVAFFVGFSYHFFIHKAGKMKFLLLLFLIFQIGYGQYPKSIHQIDKEEYKSLSKQESYFDTSGKGIIPFQTDQVASPSKTIFGYLPYWEYQTASENLQYDLLSHIAAFDFQVSTDGSVSLPSYWPWTDVINEAHSNGVKIVMCMTNFDTDEIHTILTNSTTKDNFFSNVKSIVQTYSLDGVNIDFENISSSDRGSLLNGFMADLTDFIHSELPGSEVSIAGPAVNWGGWDFVGLASSCDYIFIMGYDFYGSWGTTSGPCAPLTGGSYNVTNTVQVQYASVSQNNPEKLILGVPYYGNRWKTETSQPYATVIDYINHPRYRDGWPQSDTYGLLWDSPSQTPWYRYYEDSEWYQVWFDTDSSLGLKYNLAEANSLQGVGMWALGYDGSYPELWDELRKRYGQPSTISNTSNRIETFSLYQNYPNPFNPTTIISYQLSAISRVQLSVYNISGQKVATLVFGQQPAGQNQVSWNASEFPNGLYFYKLQTANYSEARKMMFLK